MIILIYDVYLHLFQGTIRCRSWVEFRTTGDGYSQAEIDANSKTAAAEAAAAEEVELENLFSCETWKLNLESWKLIHLITTLEVLRFFCVIRISFAVLILTKSSFGDVLALLEVYRVAADLAPLLGGDVNNGDGNIPLFTWIVPRGSTKSTAVSLTPSPSQQIRNVRRYVTFVLQLGQWLIHSNVGGGSNWCSWGRWRWSFIHLGIPLKVPWKLPWNLKIDPLKIDQTWTNPQSFNQIPTMKLEESEESSCMYFSMGKKKHVFMYSTSQTLTHPVTLSSTQPPSDLVAGFMPLLHEAVGIWCLPNGGMARGSRSENQQENEAMAVWFIYIYISGMKPTMFKRDYELVTNLDADIHFISYDHI